MSKKISHTASRLRNLPIYYWLMVFVVIFFLGAFVLSAIFKASLHAYNLAQNGISSSQQAISLLKKQDISNANLELQNASQHFGDATETLKNSNEAISIISSLPILKNTTQLLQAGQLVAEAGTDLLGVYEQLKNIQLNAQGIFTNGSIDQTTQLVIDKNLDALNKISQAEDYFNNVNTKIVPKKYLELFNNTHAQLKSLKSILTVSLDTFRGLKPLLVGKKYILLLFANDSELRPTGGFLGTYGLLTLDNGVLINVHITSIYDTDGQQTELVNPPWPLLLVNGNWLLRDSNWFINYPDSAKISSIFFEKQGHATPDAVITVTPKLFEDLLKITGPIDMPAYNLTITSDNLLSVIQNETSVKYDKVVNQPKQLIADLFPVLIQKFITLNPDQYTKLLQSLYQNISQKNFLVYSRLPELQNFAESYNLAGQIKDTPKDYLNINFANLNGTKSDRQLDDKLELFTTIYNDGVHNVLTLTRTNTTNLTTTPTPSLEYIRILVPKDSLLISSSGFDKLNIPKPYTNATNFKQVEEWKNSQQLNESTFVTTGIESGKTSFSGFIKVEPGQTKVLTVSYTEPFILDNIGNWSLVLQKQPGSQSKTFNYTLNFPGRHLDYSTVTGENDVFSYTSRLNLDQDKFYGFVLSKN